MGLLVPILLAVIGVAVVLLISMNRRGRSGGKAGYSKKSRDAILKAAHKHLDQNPKDPNALSSLGDLYYMEENWEQAHKAYSVLAEVSPHDFEANLRFGMSSLKLGLIDDAHKGLNNARKINANNFELSYNLGVLEFQKKNYEKAVQILDQARAQDPEHAPTLRTMGYALFRMKRNKEAMGCIRKAIDLAPDDKESLFTLAECYSEANQIDQALRVYKHLRGDPSIGAASCLACGKISEEKRDYKQAIENFELGLKHENIRADVRTELRYRFAACYLKVNEIGKAIGLLRAIQAENPAYKDVAMLIGKYAELNANKNLQIFLMAPSGDFVALCRKIVMCFYPKAKVKIINISVNKNEWADIVAEINAQKWSDTIVFRFIRTQGSIGELIVRDFHSHLKDVKAGKGICITVGSFSEEAKRYTEARLIDLIEKERFLAILNTVDARIAQAAPEKKR